VAITIEPLGGLGNQLFIYGLGLRLARDRNTELTCDLWNFYGYDWHGYELDSFHNSITCTYSSRSREIFGHKLRGLIRRARALHIDPTSIGHLVLERDSLFDSKVLQARNGWRLNGYFQSWRYFEPIEEELKGQISNPKNPSQWMHDMREQLSELGPWIAVHVRRGTYLEVPIMGLVGNDYYSRAISYLDTLAGKLPLVLFSDSPELLTDLQSRYEDRVTVISTPESVRPIDVLQVMSDASHLVIGNSTFSWWAAYLKDRPDRIVIAPRPWLDDRNFNERDLIPRGWLTLGRVSALHEQ
jgi:hypothetical protein